MYLEIESLEQFQDHKKKPFVSCAFQGLDLLQESDFLCSQTFQDCFFLGCQLTEASAGWLASQGCVIFPFIPNIPFHPFRGSLYTASELMAGYQTGVHSSFRDSYDAAIYSHHKQTERSNVVATLLERIHDHAVDDALEHFLSQNNRKEKAVGIMGGHSCLRNSDRYRQVAHLGHQLAQAGYLVVTGGGPGAMEAGNLGASLAYYDSSAVDQAVDILNVADKYTHPLWFDTALEVCERWPNKHESLGIPTWFYGHEPSNLFSTHIAKYFANSIREDGILSICYAGIIYAPGSAGTIQEIFQDACQNHYGSCKHISAMLFLDTDYWTKEKPVYPLLKELSQGRLYHDMLGICDDVPSAIAHIRAHPFVSP